ncbi:MAG: hypothetical protein KBD46_03865 [Candidatus Levybacteria bacterium]|nr:hypothetical protein [Candidatus Levybacteria bacterium]
MTSLFYVTDHIKMLGKWIGILIVSIIVVVFLFRFLVFLKDIIAPTPPPPPTMTWGKLPPLVFPESKYTQTFSYTINTVSGDLPVLPDRAAVYLLATPSASLQSLSNAIDLVGNVGFDQEPIRISESIYQWYNPQPPAQKLQYDIVTKNFKVTSDFLSDVDIMIGNNLPDEAAAKKTAENFLINLGDFPSDLNATKSAATFFAIQDGSLVPTTSLSNAHIIRIDFFQNDINQLPIYYPENPQSPIYILVGGGGYEGTVVEAGYTHHTITDISSTYPIYTAQEAFEQLKKGKGYVTTYKGPSTNILIQNAKLGYYLSPNIKTYLMPIIIFEGNNDFIGYISAIKE